MRFSLALFVGLLFACSSNQSTGAARAKVVPNDVAYFAGGCFWGVEHFLEKLDGVASVESGYSGGTKVAPSYQDVISGDTGHLEVVQVRFDSSRIRFRDLAKRFFEIHDPTQTNGQGPDIGQQYHSAIFYTSEAQRASAAELITTLEKRGYSVATKLRAFEKFWPAEDYHQDYYATLGKTPYCHAPVDRFGDKS